MIKKGYKTILGIVIVTFMLADDLIVPMAAEENVFVSDEAVAGSEIEAVDFVQPDGEDIQVVCDEEEYDGDLEDECEFSTMIEEADPTGFDELVDQVGAEDVPWLAEEKGENSVYSVSSDAIGDDRTYYGYIPITDLPIHHDVKPSEDMALGSDVDLSSYESPYWGNVIKDQGFTGNCWAFSTATALEAGLRKKNVNDPSISWKNMSYWACRKSDLTGEDAADYFKYEYSSATYQSGMHNCINDRSDYLFSGGSGTVTGVLFSQDRCVKDNAGNDDSSALATGDSAEIARMNDTAAKAELAKLFSSNTQAAGSYSQNYRVSDTYLLSGASSNKENIKAMIVKYGAGTIAYYPGDRENNIVTNSATGAVYNSAPPKGEDESYASHQIAVVGWDDTYPISNFQSSKAPSKPGAWICANSWGTGADRTLNGMTYISYYDDSIVNGGFSFHDVYSKDDPAGAEYFYDNNYGVNGTAIQGSYVSDKAYALAYTTKKAQTLKAISLFTYEDDLRLTISVFGNPTIENGGVDMNTNESVSSQKETIKYSGIHTIKLNKPVAMSAGQTIIVSVKPDKETKIPVTYTDKQLVNECNKNTRLNYYVGHVRRNAETSLKCLCESNDGVLNLENKCDNYIRLLTNDGVESGAASFTGSDFNLSNVIVASSTSSGYTQTLGPVTVGKIKYKIKITGDPYYTGMKHVASTVTKKGVSNDLQIEATRDGRKLTDADYKLSFKNNKFPAGYKGKNPQIIIKLGKDSDKEEKKALKKEPFTFKIRKANLDDKNDVAGVSGHVGRDPLTGKLILNANFVDKNGKKLKFRIDKTGRGKKDISASLIKYNGVQYVLFKGNGTTVDGTLLAQVIK